MATVLFGGEGTDGTFGHEDEMADNGPDWNYWLGLQHYDPIFFRRSEELKGVHGERVRALVGQRIRSVWVLWETRRDEWYNDGPIIIRTPDTQLEICVNKASELAVSFDTLDTSQTMTLYRDADEIPTMSFRWVENPTELPVKKFEGQTLLIPEDLSLKRVVGQRIETIAVGMAGAEDRDGIVSFEVFLHEGHFGIFNALDENGVRLEEPPDDLNIQSL